MYSQQDEEKVILEWFGFRADALGGATTGGRVGRFLDIGAWDGVTFSNTRRLFELGWRGVLVEPSANGFSKLLGNYKTPGADRVKLVCALVESSPGIKRFWQTDDALSTTEEAHRAKWAEAVARNNDHFQETWVPSMNPMQLAGAFPRSYEFVNLDTEGTSIRLLPHLIDAGITGELWCVERSGNGDENAAAVLLMETQGFKVVHETSDNILFGWR